MSSRGRRFEIYPFQHSVQADPGYARKIWAELQSAISKINERRTSELSFEELYRYSYNMVLHKYGDVLYNGLTDVLVAHLKTVAANISAADPEAFLTQLQTQWSWFKISLQHIRDVLMYMDRTYVPSKKKKPVYDLGISLFRDQIIRDNVIAPRLIDTVLDLIDRERNGEAIDTVLLRAVIRMLAELGDDIDSNPVYVNVFEKAFLERTRHFYAREAQLYLTETNCPGYLRKASDRMREEAVRVDSYLDAQTGDKVRNVAETELISKHMKTLIEMDNSGLIWMLRNENCEDLHLMFTLFRNIPDGEEEMRCQLKNEVRERGTALINDAETLSNPVALVSAILALKEKYDRILKTAFYIPSTIIKAAPTKNVPTPHGFDHRDNSSRLHGHRTFPLVYASNVSAAGSSSRYSQNDENPKGVEASGSSVMEVLVASSSQPVESVSDRRFVTAVNEAFERFLNSFPRCPEYISLYVDKLLRQDVRGDGDDDIDRKLDVVINLFRFLHEKDVFERYCKQHLCKRLLSNRATSHDAERGFISKLKDECGYLYTSKMETMLTDMRTSAETTEAFRASLSQTASDSLSIDLSICVLTTISWPISVVNPCNLPKLITNCCNRFEQYYYGKHEGRRLTWQTQMANAELRATFGSGSLTLDLSVSAYSMCILMLFNTVDELTFDQLLSETAIPSAELSRNLQSLAMGKYRVLVKEPRTREINNTDLFKYNKKRT